MKNELAKADALAKLHRALAVLQAAERRVSAALIVGRQRHPELETVVADLRTRTDKAWLDAVRDIGDAQARVQTYGIAAIALMMADRTDASSAADLDDDLRELHPASKSPSIGFRAGTRW